LPDVERYSLQTGRKTNVLRYVALDGIAKLSGGKARFRELADKAKEEWVESLREGAV